jgi:hypothetical protein
LALSVPAETRKKEEPQKEVSLSKNEILKILRDGK